MIKADQLIQATRNLYKFESHFLGTAIEPPLIAEASGTGAGGASTTNVAGSPGIWRLTTGTTATGRAALRTGVNLAFTQGIYTLETIFRMPTALSDATEAYIVMIGFAEQANLSAANACYIWYDYYLNPQKFNIYNAKSGGGSENIDTGVTPAQNTWYNFKTVLDESGVTHSVSVGGVEQFSQRQSNLSNLPNANTLLTPIVVVEKTAGTTARQLDLDFFSLNVKL